MTDQGQVAAPPSTQAAAAVWTPPPLPVLFVALAALSVVTAWAFAPLAEAALRSQPGQAVVPLRTGLWLAAAATPVVAVLKGLVLGGIAWAILVLGGRMPPYRRTVALVVAAEFILAAQALWTVVLLRIRGLSAVTSPDALRIPTGLDLLFPDPATPLGALATSVTPFHAAWVLFLAWCFARTAGGHRLLGAGAALACWVPGALVAVLRTLMA
jgi:hypothetical protein